MRLINIIITVILFMGNAAFADYKAGKAAYDAGDYQTAYNQLLPLAEAGDAESQFLMGNMIHVSREDRSNIDEAIKWYKMAAEQNHIIAQRKLGGMYGLKTPALIHIVNAVKWAFITYKNGDAKAKKGIENIIKNNSSQFYENGIKEANKWLVKNKFN